MVDHVFILAGGSGTRLWPASIAAKPKQLMEIRNGKSLLRLTIERALSLNSGGDVVIITTAGQLDGIVEECRKMGDDAKGIAILPEPAGRNTAPAIAAGAAFYNGQDAGSDTVLVMPADHLIEPLDAFSADVEKADSLARSHHLVTIGITPDKPETGFGYIEAGDEIPGGNEVRSFREKPDVETAREYLQAGTYFWNSGMFCFSLDLLNTELKKNAPEIADIFGALPGNEVSREIHGMRILMESDTVKTAYTSSPRISFDYAVMETCRNVAMVPSTFTWNDVGSWDEIAKLDLEQPAPVICEESNGSFVYSDLPVAICGLEDVIVVVKNGRVLVARKGATQLVKDVVEDLREQGLEDLL